MEWTSLPQEGAQCPSKEGKVVPILFLISLFISALAFAKAPQRVNRTRPAPVAAPSEYSPRLMIGFNFSYGAADPAAPGATRNAPSFLASMDLPLGNSWYFCPGIGLLARGVQTTVYTLGSLDIKGTVHLDYLELPFLLKKTWASSFRGLRYTFFGGPALAIAIQRQVELLGAVDLDISNRFFATDTLLYAGAGLEYQGPTGPGFIAELRYAFGLGDIDRTANQYRTRGILFLMGIKF